MEKLWDLMRACPRCGKSWGAFEWLCPSCEAWWFSKLRLHHRWLFGRIAHYYLMSWRKGDQMTPLIHSLKGGGSYRPIQKMSLFFPHFPKKTPLFFPSSGAKDHAYELAKALSQGELNRLNPLLKKGFGKQSLMSRKERQKREFQSPCRGKITKVHLVDDIVTSGETVRACYRALGKPAQMTVWSLFYRESL